MTIETWWLADAWTMTARPVRCRRVDADDQPDPDGRYMQPVRRSDRRYLGSQFFRERWEAEADIVLQLANGDRPLREIAAAPPAEAGPGE